MTQVMSPRRTSQRRASRSASTSRWRRTAPCRADETVADVGGLLEPLLGGEARHPCTERFGDHGRIARQRARAACTAASYDTRSADPAHGHCATPSWAATHGAASSDGTCEATEPGRAAPQRQRREDRLDDEERHRARRERPEVHAGARRFADDREARPRGVGVEAYVAVLVGARAGAVVAGERARDQPALDDRGRQRIGERRDA